MTLPNSATIDTYGGAKVNADPIENPQTDASANDWNALICDAAAMSRMVPRAWIRFTGATYTSGTQSITVEAHDAVWGNATEPTVTQTATGVYNVTWAATYTDELGATVTPSLRDIMCVTFSGSTVRSWVKTTVSAHAITITVQTVGSTPAANSANGQSISVWVF